MALEHLRFFNKQGSEITPELEDGIFKLSLYFKKVSTNLFETETLYIFEEILKNVGRSVDLYSKMSEFEPLEIKIMNFLSDKDKVNETELLNFFDWQTLGTDAVEEFVAYRPNYIERFWEAGNWYVSLTQDGYNYLESYKKNVLDLKNKNFGYIPELVRPRSNFETKLDQSFFYFKWVNNKYEDNIFNFEISNLDKTVYYRNEKAICEDKGKTYPNIIKYKNSDLDITNGVLDRNFFIEKYGFDNGISDAFEDPTFEIYYTENEDGSFTPQIIQNLPNYKLRRILVENDINHDPIKLNFAITSDVEGSFNRTLELFFVKRNYRDPDDLNSYIENTYKIAEINLYGETVGEDERLPKILENFGRKIEKADFYIFKESDIDDDFEDNIFINNKYKELLLVGDEIFPYLGSYKAFRNALKWLGYQDLNIKEYFYNIKLSDLANNKARFQYVDIPKEIEVPKNIRNTVDWQTWVYGDLIENPNFIKTSRLGLSYSINKFTGQWDEFGYPIMEDNYEYSIDEFMIKLYGLKKILEKYFLPHHVKIIDIAAEGVYFIKYKVLTWDDFDKMINLEPDTSVNFECSPEYSYLSDLKKLIFIYKRLFHQFEEVSITNKLNNLKDINLNFLRNEVLSISNNKEIRGEYKLFFGEGEPCCNASYPDGNSYYIDELTGYFYESTSYKNGNQYCNKIYANKDCYWNFVEDLNLTTVQIFGDSNLVPIYKILKSYPTEQQLKQAFLDQILKFTKEYSDKNIYNLIDLNNIKGSAINLKLLPRDLVWADLRFNFDFIKYIDNFSNNDGSKVFSLGGMLDYNGYGLRWTIVNSDDPSNFKFTIEGNISKLKDYVIFVPKIGKYDIMCEVVDLTNTRRIKRKRKCFEVKNRVYDFYALGSKQYKKYNSFDSVNSNILFNDVEGNLNNYSLIKENQEFDIFKTNLIWNKLNYSYYLNQNALKDYVKYSKIIDIDRQNNIVTLQDNDFYNNYNQYKDQYVENTLVFEKSYLDNNFYKLESFTNQQLVINEKIPIEKNSRFLLTQILQFDSSNFFIKDDVIIVRSKYYTFFQQNDFVDLKYKDKYYTYKIQSINYDLTGGYIYLEIKNDSSLNYINDNVTSTSFNKFEKLEIQRNPILLYVKDFTYADNSTIINIDSVNILKIYAKNKEVDWYILPEPTYGELVYNIKSVDSINNNSVIKLDDDICKLTPFYDAKWIEDFSYNYANIYNNSNINWNKLKNVKFQDIVDFDLSQFNLKDFPNFGFTIIDVGLQSGLQIGDQIEYFDLININPTFRINKALEILKNSKQSNFRNFEFYLIENKIKAKAKINSKSEIYDIQGIKGCTVSINNLPNGFIDRWQQIYFDGYNNPPNWNDLYDISQNKYNSRINGFLSKNSIITKNRLKLNPGHTLFFTFEESMDFDNDTEFEWEIWDENNSKLLTKSKKNFLIWTFTKNSLYTVIMKVKINDQIISIVKKNLIEIISNDI
jgi:hypothetical protein